MDTLEEMFVHELEEMYYVENRLVDILDEFATDANNDHLRDGFEEHREETRNHVNNLDAVFDALDRPPEQRESLVLEALVEERTRFREQTTDEQLRDLFDMQAAMKNERMEITGYQGLLTLAKRIDYTHDVTDYLEDNLSSEKSTLRKLEGMSKGSKFKSMVGQLLS